MGTLLSKVRDELETVNNLASCCSSALHTNRKNTSESISEVLLRIAVARVVLQTWVRHPGDILVLLQPAGQGQGVAGVAFAAQAEGLDPDQELLGSEGVQGASDISQELDTDTDGKGD